MEAIKRHSSSRLGEELTIRTTLTELANCPPSRDLRSYGRIEHMFSAVSSTEDKVCPRSQHGKVSYLHLFDEQRTSA